MNLYKSYIYQLVNLSKQGKLCIAIDNVLKTIKGGINLLDYMQITKHVDFDWCKFFENFKRVNKNANKNNSETKLGNTYALIEII